MKRSRCRCGAYLFVRPLHTVLSLGVAATLFFKNTELRAAVHMEFGVKGAMYAGVFITLLVFSLVMYFAACLTNPGFVPIENRKRAWDSDEEDAESCTEQSSMLEQQERDETKTKVRLRRCGFCGIEQPLRARHCEECGRCVRKFDHHCPWLDTCVGEQNHRFFWLFLISTAALIIWAFIITWRAIEYKAEWMEWMNCNVFFVVDLVVLLCGGVPVMCLASFHTYLMFLNMTTWEVVSRERITYLKILDEESNPFHEGYFKNIYHFLCSVGARKWELIYRKFTTLKD